MNYSKISVIVPVYNLENYIEKTLDSICAQTYSNMEIIVVDDGSTDNSYQVICDYANKDSRVIPIQQENGGVTSARLNGVKHATGEWIGFVDGDDLIDEDMYEILINNAHKYNAQISHCGYKMVFDDGRENYFYNSGKIVEQDNLKGLCDLLNGTMIEPGLWNKLFYKELFCSLLNDDLMDLSIKIFEDLLMNYYLFKQSNKSVFEDVCKYQYLVRKGSASRTISKNSIYDPIKVKRVILNDANISIIKKVAFEAYVSTCNNVYCSLVVNDADKKDEKNIRKIIVDNYKELNQLSKRNKLYTLLITKTPHLFELLYKVYSKYFQKKKYV